MNYGICTQSLVPVRIQPGDRQEMVNQLLFGDLLVIKGHVKEWLLIETFDDQYEGWVDQKQVLIIENETFNELIVSDRFYSLSLASEVFTIDHSQKLSFTRGAFLPGFADHALLVNGLKYDFHGEVIRANDLFDTESLINIAQSYLGMPYLWGGRSPFGIDCSGFVQIVYKMCGLLLPRDASQQVQHGENVSFVTEGKIGDLAFFGNEEGDINHVGILIGNDKIIHASGQVRIDKIDHQGIYNVDTNQYSHQLRVIKRVQN